MRHSKAVMERTNIEAEIRQASEQLVGLEVLFVQQDFCMAYEKLLNTPFRKVLSHNYRAWFP
jgi:collagenase-like PrtC family protease